MLLIWSNPPKVKTRFNFFCSVVDELFVVRHAASGRHAALEACFGVSMSKLGGGGPRPAFQDDGFRALVLLAPGTVIPRLKALAHAGLK